MIKLTTKTNRLATPAKQAKFLLIFYFILISPFIPIAATTPENIVKTGDFTQTLVLTGSLEAQKAELFVVPLTNTWQIQVKWMINEGEYAKPGDPVVRFDTSSVNADIVQLEDSLLLKQEQKKQKEDELNHQQFELDVNVKKAEVAYKKAEIDATIPRGIEADYDFDRKQLELKRANQLLEAAQRDKLLKLEALKAEIARIGIEIQEAQAQLDRSRTILDKLTLIATTAGPVIYSQNRWQGRKIQVGDNVFPGLTVATIPDNSSLQVTLWVNETDIRKISPGQSVDMLLDAFPQKPFSGTLTDVLTNAEEKEQWGKSNYFRANIKLDKIDASIMKPGMSVKCVVTVLHAPGALLIPLSMAYYSNPGYWIKPQGQPPIPINPIGINEFFLAITPVPAQKNSTSFPLTNGTPLEPVDPQTITISNQLQSKPSPPSQEPPAPTRSKK